jgi:hypothetical protein
MARASILVALTLLAGAACSGGSSHPTPTPGHLTSDDGTYDTPSPAVETEIASIDPSRLNQIIDQISDELFNPPTPSASEALRDYPSAEEALGWHILRSSDVRFGVDNATGLLSGAAPADFDTVRLAYRYVDSAGKSRVIELVQTSEAPPSPPPASISDEKAGSFAITVSRNDELNRLAAAFSTGANSRDGRAVRGVAIACDECMDDLRAFVAGLHF